MKCNGLKRSLYRLLKDLSSTEGSKFVYQTNVVIWFSITITKQGLLLSNFFQLKTCFLNKLIILYISNESVWVSNFDTQLA